MKNNYLVRDTTNYEAPVAYDRYISLDINDSTHWWICLYVLHLFLFLRKIKGTNFSQSRLRYTFISTHFQNTQEWASNPAVLCT